MEMRKAEMPPVSVGFLTPAGYLGRLGWHPIAAPVTKDPSSPTFSDELFESKSPTL